VPGLLAPPDPLLKTAGWIIDAQSVTTFCADTLDPKKKKQNNKNIDAEIVFMVPPERKFDGGMTKIDCVFATLVLKSSGYTDFQTALIYLVVLVAGPVIKSGFR